MTQLTLEVPEAGTGHEASVAAEGFKVAQIVLCPKHGTAVLLTLSPEMAGQLAGGGGQPDRPHGPRAVHARGYREDVGLDLQGARGGHARGAGRPRRHLHPDGPAAGSARCGSGPG